MKQAHDSISHLGLWLYLMTDCIVFASLFATYAVLLRGTAGGPAPQDLFDPTFILISTLVLLVSTLTAGLAMINARQGKRLQTVYGLLATALFGAVFIGMELYEFTHILNEGYSWQTSAFLSAFFSLVGLHGAHILAGLVWLGVILYLISRKGLNTRTVHAISLFTIFWHFLDVVWIFIFTYVYMTGVVL